MMKYIELMHHDETKRKKLKYLQMVFSFLMIMRGVSENILRTGSEIIYVMLQDKIDIEVSIESNNEFFLLFNNVLYLF